MPFQDLLNCEAVEQVSFILNPGESPPENVVMYIVPEPGFQVEAGEFQDVTLTTYADASPNPIEYLNMTLDTPIEINNTLGAGVPGNKIEIIVHLNQEFTATEDTTIYIDIAGKATEENVWTHTVCLVESLTNMVNNPTVSARYNTSIEIIPEEDVTYSGPHLIEGSPEHGDWPDFGSTLNYFTADDYGHYFTATFQANWPKKLATVRLRIEDGDPSGSLSCAIAGFCLTSCSDFPEFAPRLDSIYGSDYEGNLKFQMAQPATMPNMGVGFDNDPNAVFIQPTVGNYAYLNVPQINTLGNQSNMTKRIDFDLYYIEDPLNLWGNMEGEAMVPEVGQYISDRTCMLQVPMTLMGGECGNSGGTAPATHNNQKAIRKFSTNLKSLSGSENIIPSGGINKVDRVIATVTGDEGAKFSMEFLESKLVEIDSGSSRSAGYGENPAPTIVDFPRGEVKIPKSGIYRFYFPDVDNLSITDGWKEFEMTLTAGDGSTLGDLISGEHGVAYNVGQEKAYLVNTYYQYPNVSVKLTATKDAAWSYVTNYNVTDIQEYGKAGSRKFGKAKEMVEKSIRFEIRVYDSGTTFSLNLENLDPVYTEDKDKTILYYKPKADMFVPEVKDNGDKVSFDNTRVHIGNGTGDTDNDYATLIGYMSIRQLGIRSQVYSIDLTKIFNNT